MHRSPAPFDLGPVHFIGIGGIGMSGIAEIMLRRGYPVYIVDFPRRGRAGYPSFIGTFGTLGRNERLY